jgi:HD-like signal output (HDOD) protein
MDEQLYQEQRKKSELTLSNVYNLPAMSATMLEVSKLLDDPSTNTAALSKIIGKDQGLSTKILSIANSPLYGLTRKVSTIDFAILIIGYQDIKNIVVALTMVDSFKNKSDKYLDQNSFWQHSMLAGTAAKRVAEDLGFRIGSEAFVAGLLHLSLIHI